MLRKKIMDFLDILIGSEVAYKFSRRYYLGPLFPFVQAVTYHGISAESKTNLREQLRWYSNNYVNCRLSDLRNLLSCGTWDFDKPGLIISFDDGLRSNFDVALPLLEEYGFTGWFMIPAGFIESEPNRQIEFARRNLIDYNSEYINERIAMSWDELRELERRGHIVTCHSMNHKRLSDKLTQSDLEIEINDSKKMLESRLGHPIDSFTWVGGEKWAYGRGAYKMMLTFKYALVFCTNCAPITAKQSPYFLQRYHVESNYQIERIRLVLGGFYDFMYIWKRWQVLRGLVQ